MRTLLGGAGRRAALVVLLGLVGGLVAQVGPLSSPAAAARLVANPGPFSVRADGGGVKIGGEVFEFEGADADDVQFNGTIASDGTITVPASGISFPVKQVEASGVTATVRINPVGADGSLDPTTGLLQLRIRFWIKIDGIPLSGGCRIGSASSPIDINMAATNDQAPNLVAQGLPAPRPYNSANGDFVIADNDFAVPGTSDCGVAGGTVNSEVGIPSPAGNNELLIDAFTVTAFQPAVSAFTVSPNPVVVNKTTTLNASGTTTTNLTRFEFDPEGDGTYVNNGTNPVRTHAYPTTGTFPARMRAVYSDGNNVERTVNVSVQPNAAPTANDQNVSTAEETVKSITLTGSDPNGDTLAFSVTTLPTHGSITGTAPNLSYTPAGNYNGPDSIGFTVNDGNGGSDTGVVSITVTPVNDAPVANDGNLAVTEDLNQGVTLVATDIDGNPLTYSITTPPTKGSVACAPAGAPSCTYSPNHNATGADSFVFTASDGVGGSDTGTISVTITGVNDPPTATDQNLSTVEDTTLDVTLGGTDPDGTPVTATVTGLPAHGSLSGTAPNITYTPAPHYAGPDAFTFQVSDGAGGVDAGTITITVTPANDPPVAGDLEVTTPEETPVGFTLPATDLDGTDTLAFTVDGLPTNGDVGCTAAGSCTYTPDAGFAGPDALTFTVSDGNGGTDTGSVAITVSALVNFAPVFTTPGSLAVIEDVARTFTLAATDADGDTVAFSVASPPAAGSLACSSAGACTYTPAPNGNGSASATVAANDGRGGVTTKVLTFTTIPVNDAPVASPQSTSTDEDTAVDVDLVAIDHDGEALTWIVKVAPSHGTASITGSTLTYTPATGYVGPDTLDVEALDPNGGRSRVTIDVVVHDVDEAPIAGTVAIDVPEDGVGTVALPASDPDGGPLTVEVGTGFLGTLSCVGLDCTYDAADDATGTDTIAYTVTDDDGITASGSVVVTIVPGEDDPMAIDQTVSTTPGAAKPITLGAFDPDHDDLTFEVDTVPAFGTVTGTPPEVVYTSAPTDAGTVTFDFTVTDETGRRATGTVTVVVQPGPQDPTAQPITLTAAEDTAVAVTLAGNDAEGPVTYSISGGPSHGSLTGVAPLLTYTPAANYSGPDGFTYTATDSDGNVATADVTIAVAPVNDRPVAEDTSATTTRTVAVPIPLVASDAEPGTLTYTVSDGPNHGTVNIVGSNALYTPAGLYQGPDAFTFRATDAGGLFGTGTVTIDVQAGGPLATTLTAGPGATATKAGLALNWTYANLNATLTVPAAGGAAVAGQVVQFRVGASLICSATTGADGRAACGGMGPLLGARGTSYTATFAGNAAYAASTTSRAL